MATRSTPRRDQEVLSAAARVFHARGYADGDVDAAEDARVLTRLVFGTMIMTYSWFRAGRDDPEQVADSCAEFAIRGVTGGGD